MPADDQSQTSVRAAAPAGAAAHQTPAPTAPTDPTPHPTPAHQTPTRGYSASKPQLQKRLRRIEGQVRGVQAMVEDDRYCIDVLTQISAIEAALDKVALALLDGHTHHCVMGAAEGAEREAKTDELMAAVGRLMRRS